MTNFNDFLNEQMKDPEFKAEWDALDPEFSVIEAMLKARKESGLTQKQLSSARYCTDRHQQTGTRQCKPISSYLAAACCWDGNEG